MLKLSRFAPDGAPEEDSDSMVLTSCERPSSIRDARGKWISVSEESGLDALLELEGYVEAVSEKHNVLYVTFNSSAHTSPMQIPFSKPLHWFVATRGTQREADEHTYCHSKCATFH